ncbi:hypothetical protein VCHA28O22_130147 [Vibrio chagasii]|nr:hypothetical protein [Vibrio splendidus]CAH6810305.1 hypothetical protein VCHA28O22_130147 [Vibrio chagasii]CAH6963170.1 hypothetical protein VCHA50O393_140008 [Vibrio chagasii]CAH6985870.1 hypothetical protein VCHA53O474_140008 [Vibrio chagasii]
MEDKNKLHQDIERNNDEFSKEFEVEASESICCDNDSPRQDVGH